MNYVSISESVFESVFKSSSSWWSKKFGFEFRHNFIQIPISTGERRIEFAWIGYMYYFDATIIFRVIMYQGQLPTQALVSVFMQVPNWDISLAN